MASICGWSLAGRSRGRLAAAAVAVAVIVATTGLARVATPRFYPDDPLWAEDDMALDASGAAPIEDANSYDFVVNTFSTPGEKRDVRALNVNTLDEVPDSSWFQNRSRQSRSVAEIVRGPDQLPSVSLEGWMVSGGKSTGVQPGFRMTDPQGQLYQIELDPPDNPEMASAAEIIGTAFYHGFGYNVVDVYLAELDPDRLVISEKATLWDPREARRRRLTRRELDKVLRRGAKQDNGKYRVIVSRFAAGTPLGNFRYYGTRPDDPNDIVLHEHRRELRGARVFAAWLNHDDSRGVNSLDMLATEGPRKYIKHYMFDFGSILGSGTVYAQRHRPGNEYILEWKPGWLTLATLGFYTRPWLHIDYPDDLPPAVGRVEGTAFNAAEWKPEYPNQAFDNMRPDDAFWAARIVSRFDPASIRAIVEKARYTDPRATAYMTEVLLKRQEKVLRTWLTGVNPVVELALGESGELTFENAAEKAGVASPAHAYVVQWSRFDNTTGTATNVGQAQEHAAAKFMAPADLVASARQGDYVEVTIAARHAEHAAWMIPVTAHFRRGTNRWELVGLQRLP